MKKSTRENMGVLNYFLLPMADATITIIAAIAPVIARFFSSGVGAGWAMISTGAE